MRPLVMALSVALALSGTACVVHSFTRMPDGRQWTTENLHANLRLSYCYEDSDSNCRQYGRLYPWESAPQACSSLGHGWRLPTDDDWRQLVKSVGGVFGDSDDQGHAAYAALLVGGRTGFNAQLGGGRSEDGQYARIQAHGFYWTATAIDATHAWFYNFALGGQAIYRQDGGEKSRAFSVRCVRE
jgi:uncharacterized protein (TIGR02145 family)